MSWKQPRRKGGKFLEINRKMFQNTGSQLMTADLRKMGFVQDKFFTVKSCIYVVRLHLYFLTFHVSGVLFILFLLINKKWFNPLMPGGNKKG